MFRMLSIPATRRLNDAQVRPHLTESRKSPALDPRPAGAPIICEMERIRMMREQRRRNVWRSYCQTQETAPQIDVTPDSPTP